MSTEPQGIKEGRERPSKEVTLSTQDNALDHLGAICEAVSVFVCALLSQHRSQLTIGANCTAIYVRIART
jgi:hypothetical protein